MTIEVTGCHDCPFNDPSYWCQHVQSYVALPDKEFHPSCPLKQETITIKLKENDTTDND